MLKVIEIKTKSRTEFVDITLDVAQAVSTADVTDGICVVYVPHTTAAVTVNENADPAVQTDIIAELNKLVPFDENYRHLEGNAAAHIKSTIAGCSQNFIIDKGRLVLGRWQAIFFCEFDGPRNRQVFVKVFSK